MGCSKESTGDELRQIEQIVEVLLREGYNAEGSGRKIRVQIRLRSGSAFQHGVRIVCGIVRASQRSTKWCSKSIDIRENIVVERCVRYIETSYRWLR